MKYIYISIVTMLALAGCATLCKVPGVGMLPGVSCPSPSPTLLPPILS